jgi:ribosomal protein S18 acetylase RimI-like enzyme
MSQSVSITLATANDLTAIEELMRELIDVLRTEEGINRQELTKSLDKLYKAQNSYMLIAKKDSKAIGFAQFYTRQTALNPQTCAALDELVVAKEYRRQGIGKLLIERVINECRKLGCCEVEVSTELTNTIAQKFYKDCGFTKEGMLLEKHL